MSIEENRARYKGSVMEALMSMPGHTVCERCYCCDAASESVSCWQCGGFPDDDEDEGDGWCSACKGEGEIYFMECIGRCDQNGDHKRKAGEPEKAGSQ